MIPLDVFSSGIELPHDVYIVGTGPNGVKHYGEIPADACVIVVNKGIRIPQDMNTDWRASYWLCWTSIYRKQAWFENSVLYPTALRIFGYDPKRGEGLSLRESCDHSFLGFPSYNPEDNDRRRYPNDAPPGLIQGVLRCGGTIAGNALQFAYWFGAKRATLCGVDMRGLIYYDGTSYADYFPQIAADVITTKKMDYGWWEREWCQRIVADCKSAGMDVLTLSDTALTGVERA